MRKLLSSLKDNFDLILFMAAVNIKALIYGSQIGGKYFSYKNILFPTIASVLIIASFLVLLKKRKVLLIIMNLLISIILVCDINYFRYFKDIPSLSVLRNGMQLGAVNSSLISLFKIIDLFYFCDFIVFIAIKKYFKNLEHNKLSLKSKLSIFAFILSLGVSLNGIYIYRLSIDQPRLLTTMFNRVYIASELGILNAHGVDVFNKVMTGASRFASISEERKASIKNFLETSSNLLKVNLKGEAKDKNLIVIQVEALQQFVINKSIEGQEITPNINKFLKRSAYFNNFFYQISAGGTSDAEFLVNNSLYPAPSGAAYHLYSGNDYYSLPLLLKDKGYSTAAFHGYKSTFWNRDIMYNAIGFDHFYSDRDFELTSTIGLGLSDKAFLEQTAEKLKLLKNPYYAFLITLSSHYPFDDKSAYDDFYVGSLSDTLIGNYIKTIHYTDKALGDFLEGLEQNGVLDNSIVVLYGDHSAIPEDNKEEFAEYMGVEALNELDWTMLQKVPMLIHFPQDKNVGIYENYGGQIDMLPTLANLFQLENKASFGKDLFNSKDETVIFRNGSFLDGTVYYSASSGSYYNIKDSSIIEENEELQAKREDVLVQLEYSDDILKHDLLNKYSDSEN
jgi:phosphoglycerol transferase MdoB-like AlkP superfamily enzyme